MILYSEIEEEEEEKKKKTEEHSKILRFEI